MSGLKNHSVWFVAPFDFQGTRMNASRIRDSLVRHLTIDLGSNLTHASQGDFSRIIHQPARLAARWSQAFSTTDPTVTLDPSEIGQMADRISANGSIFTDGCGTISCELARVAWTTLRSQKGQVSGSKHVPSCFQIRLGGTKGVVVVGVLVLPPHNRSLGKTECSLCRSNFVRQINFSSTVSNEV
jgi:hypothetical protein